MSNVVDFAVSAKRIKDLRVLNAFLDEGLNSTDMAIISLASNRAFTKDTEIPTIAEVAAMGNAALRYLTCTVFEDDVGSVFQFSNNCQTVLQYIICTEPMTYDWHEVTALKYSLVGLEDAGRWVAHRICTHLQENNQEEVSIQGFFALDVFYFACNSSLEPLHLQIFPGRNMVGMLLYDPEREVEIVIIAEMDEWLSPPNQEKDKTIQCSESSL